MGREALVVLQEVHEPQGGIEGLDLEGALESAGPLPPSMDSLCIQDMVRGQKEPRSQGLEEALILAMVVLGGFTPHAGQGQISESNRKTNTEGQTPQR